MKRMFKIGWIVLIIGLVALLFGWLNHGDKNVDFVNGRPQLQRHGEWKLTNKQFDKLNIDVTAADVTIKHGVKYRVSYRGLVRNRPTVAVNNHTLTVKQSSSGNGVFGIHANGGDHLVITIPHDAQLTGGKITGGSGNLSVDGVDLTNMAIDVYGGEVSLTDLTVQGGQTDLGSGNFTARGLRVNGHYRVKNESGDNDVDASAIDGYRLHTASGENTVNGQDKDDQSTVTEGMDAANTLELITESGDNEYHY